MKCEICDKEITGYDDYFVLEKYGAKWELKDNVVKNTWFQELVFKKILCETCLDKYHEIKQNFSDRLKIFEEKIRDEKIVDPLDLLISQG